VNWNQRCRVFLIPPLTVALKRGRDCDDVPLLGMDITHRRGDLRMPGDSHQSANVRSDPRCFAQKSVPQCMQSAAGTEFARFHGASVLDAERIRGERFFTITETGEHVLAFGEFHLLAETISHGTSDWQSSLPRLAF